jgi:hypothetical protein
VTESKIEHTVLQKYMEEISKSLLKLSQFNLNLAVVVETTFTEPLEMFHQESYKGNLSMFKQIKNLVMDVDILKKESNKAKQEYF